MKIGKKSIKMEAWGGLGTIWLPKAAQRVSRPEKVVRWPLLGPLVGPLLGSFAGPEVSHIDFVLAFLLSCFEYHFFIDF